MNLDNYNAEAHLARVKPIYEAKGFYHREGFIFGKWGDLFDFQTADETLIDDKTKFNFKLKEYVGCSF